MKEIRLSPNKVALVDDEDYEYLNQFKWLPNFTRGYYYAYRLNKTENKKIGIMMHRFIMNCPPDKVIDHINGNGLDNRKENLRICTHSQNMCNRRKHKSLSSIYLGVSWNNSNSKWLARIKNIKQIYLGCYNTEEEAALVYNQKAIEIHGEYARLNQI